MARPSLPGIYYYPLDVDFTHDRKFRRISRRFGLLAHAAIPALWCMIYKEKGYYIDWNTDTCYDLSEEIGCDEPDLQQLVDYCLEVGLFDAGMYREYGILTSAGVQRRYEKVRIECKRKHGMDECYRLVAAEEDDEKDKDHSKAPVPKGKRKKKDTSGAGTAPTAAVPSSLPDAKGEADDVVREEIFPGRESRSAREKEDAASGFSALSMENREISGVVSSQIPEETTSIREETTGKQEETTGKTELMPQRKGKHSIAKHSRGKQTTAEDSKISSSPLSPPPEGRSEDRTKKNSFCLPDGYPADIPVYAWNTQTHNLAGLVERLRILRVTDDEELLAILRLSDYGRKHTTVWSIISVNNWPEAQNRSSSRFRQITKPGKYILKILSNGFKL